MILLKKNNKLYNKYLYHCNLKYNIYLNYIFVKGKFGLLKYSLYYFNKFSMYKFLIYFNNIYSKINIGWISILFLNGLGFKSTRKVTSLKQKYWRFNVGHSHVFQYFVPENVILKSRNRYICVFSYDKSQIFNLTQKLKSFKQVNVYKGTGIQYLNELKITKVGKLKQ